MEPGPELDQLIAEKVMGYNPMNRARQTSNLLDVYGNEIELDRLEYSTQISAVWEVVEKINLFKTHSIGKTPEDRWFVERIADDEVFYADTAPHAICLAALKAVEA